MITVVALGAILHAYHQPNGARCTGALFAVQDDLPLQSDVTIRREGGLKSKSGEIVGLVFLTNTGRIYVQTYRSMNSGDQIALDANVPRGNLHSPVRELKRPIPDDLTVVQCVHE